MGELKVKDREIVVPGEILAKGMDYLPSGAAFREKENIIASQVGLVNISGRLVKLVPLSGVYNPRRGDTVIGVITNVSMSSWTIDIGDPYLAMLPLKEATSEYIERGTDLSNYYKHDDIVVAKITNVTKSKLIDLTMKGVGLRKLRGGCIIEVSPPKVPRIIGKEGSMVSLIKEKTDTKMIVGQNGKVWIYSLDPKNVLKAIEAVKFIEKNAHKEGLTDQVKKLLEKK